MSVRKTPCIVQDISSVPVELDIWLCSKICFRALKRRRDELRQLDIEKGMCIPTSLAVQIIRGVFTEWTKLQVLQCVRVGPEVIADHLE